MTHIEQRGDTAANWTSANPVLFKNEVGWETDTRKSKLGDGTTQWNSLAYSTSVIPASVALTGNPTAPTPATGDDDTSIATTEFVKNQNYAPIASPAFTGNPTAPTPTASDNDTSLATTKFVKDQGYAVAADITAIVNAAILAASPVGSIKITTANVNPGTYLGGTWVAWGAGRVPVGVDAAQTEFDTVEETGGEKVHTLTAAEIPSHSHGLVLGVGAQVVGNTSGDRPARSTDGAPVSGFRTPSDIHSSTGFGSAAVGGGSHNNLQPYITCYMWKRTV